MEKWREDAQNGRTHEPSDVTIELDGLGRQLSELSAGTGPVQESGPERESISEGSDKPVFVDASGRRSKKFRRAGWIVAIACACYAVTLVAALIGGSSSAPWLQLPGLKLPGLANDKNKETVEVQPGPSDSASVGVTPGGATAVPSPTDSNGHVIPRPSGSTTGGTTDTPHPGTSNSVPPTKPPAGGLVGGAAGGTGPGTGVPPSGDTGTPPGSAGGSGAGGATDGPPADPGTSPDPGTPTDTPTEPVDGPSALEGGSEPAMEGAQ